MKQELLDVSGQDILGMTYPEFKGHIVDAHSILTDGNVTKGFSDGRGRSIGPGVHAVPPVKEDQDNLLRQAHDSAVQEGLGSGLAALHLGAAIVTFIPLKMVMEEYLDMYIQS